METDILNMAVESSFQFGLTLSNKSMYSIFSLANAFALCWMTNPLGNGCIILLEKKNQVVKEALNQCYQVSNRVDVDPSECASMFGGLFLLLLFINIFILVHVHKDLGKMNIL